MDLTIRIAVYVLALNAFLVIWVVYLRFKIWLRAQKGFDVIEFLASLPRDFKVVDPWILLNGKWVKTAKASYNPSPAT